MESGFTVSGTVKGVPETAEEATLLPMTLRARSFTEYVVPLVSEEINKGLLVPEATVQLLPPFVEYSYPVIGAFESAEPAVNATERYAFPAVMLFIVGAPGAAAGITEILGEVSTLEPAALVATTVT